jgi:microcystin-dependent protein
MWAGGSTTTATYTDADVPTGFLLCDGTAVSRTTYSTLFTNLDIRYGNGDGSTTFNLPNLIAFAPVGSKTASAKTSGIRGTANAVATSYTTTGATSTTAHHSHTLTGSNSTASNIALTGSNSTASNIGITGSNSTASTLAITGANSNIGHAGHSHKYQKPTSNYFETDTQAQSVTVVTGSNSNIGLSGSNAAASSIALSGSNAAASNLSAATLTTGNTTAHSHTISGHAVVYIIKF